MKKAKKLLVTLLVLTFVLSSFSVGFAADEKAEEKLPLQVIRAQALGILKGDDHGNLNLDKPITRAEALALIIRISGLETSSELMKGQTRFADANTAPSLQWATGYINLGVSQSIINGFPDGTFKGNNQVTYAEMAKMIIYAMNYGVTVEGAPWPAGVMAKADDLKLFDKVNATPNLPAIRGDVVKMIDNSLTVKHLVQTGYGDLKSYEEGDKTFLSKMDVKEIKDLRVTAVDAKKSKITVDKKTYKVLVKDVDIEGLLGVEVTVWANDDDEIFFVDANVDDVKIDIVKEKVDKDDTKIKVEKEDTSYKIAKDVKVYINGETADLDDLKAGYYGYFVLNDDGNVSYINVKNWNEVNAGVVTKVDTKDKIITYFNQDDSDDEVDLDDPDDGFVITLNGKVIELGDIKANDVLYVADYDDMYHITVVRNSVEGKVERVKDDELKIDGKSYKINKDLTTYSTDKDKNVKAYEADKVADMAGEKALAIIDLAGKIRHITSDVKASEDLYGVLTKVDDYNEVVKIYANGSSKSYDVDGDIYIDDKKVTGEKFTDLKKYAGGSKSKYGIVKFELDKAGEIDKLYLLAGYDDSNDKLVDKVDDVELDFVAKDGFNDKHDTIKTEKKGTFFVTSSTKIIDDIKDMDDVKWENVKSKSISEKTAEAIFVSNRKGDANLVVFVKGFDNISDDKEVGVILDKFTDDGDWKVTVDVHDGKKVDYLLKNRNDVEIGQAIQFKLNSKNEVTDVTAYVYESKNKVTYSNGAIGGKVEKKDGSYVYLDGSGTAYKTDSLTLIYDVTDGLDDVKKASLSDVKAGKSNIILVTEGRAIKVLYIVSEETTSGSKSERELVKAVNQAETVSEMNRALQNIGAEDIKGYKELSFLKKNELARTMLDLSLTFNTKAEVMETIKDLAKEISK